MKLVQVTPKVKVTFLSDRLLITFNLCLPLIIVADTFSSGGTISTVIKSQLYSQQKLQSDRKSWDTLQ